MSEQAIKRVDRRTFKHDATTVVRHRCGWVDVWGVAALAGVLQYPEFETAEYVDAAELADPSSLDTVHGVPLTLGHPPEGEDVTSANARDLTHGWVLGAEMRGTELWTRIRFATDDALAALQEGTVELSLGYDAIYVDGAGTAPDGTPYTGVQRRRRYNHLSLVDLARAGHGARVRLDSARRDARRLAMHTLAIGKQTRQIAKFMADAFQSEAATFAKNPRRDEIPNGEVIIDGTKLVLPKATIDAIIAMIGGEGAATEPPAPEAPIDGAPAAGSQPPGIRADAAQPNVGEIVRRHVADALAQERSRAGVERKASTILGDGFDYSDPWHVCVEAITRVDAAKGDEAKRRLDAARNDKADPGTRGEARGYLLARLDDAVAAHRDAQDSSIELGNLIDEGRRSDAANTGEAAKPVDPVGDARTAMRDRLFNRKPATAASAAK